MFFPFNDVLINILQLDAKKKSFTLPLRTGSTRRQSESDFFKTDSRGPRVVDHKDGRRLIE